MNEYIFLKTKLYSLGLLVWLSSANLFGQPVMLDYTEEPLNEILLDLNEQYQLQVSINAELSAGCQVTIQQECKTMEKALEILAKKCQLTLSRINEVYSFRSEFPRTSQEDLTTQGKDLEQFLYQGKVIETNSSEPLPFSSIQITGKGLTTDQNGNFSFKSPNKNEFVRFRSMGYVTLDTLLMHGNDLIVFLPPKTVELDEIMVVGESEVPVTHIGENAGHIKFNNINNKLVPGLSNNLIFNYLRLYPGVMASGESIADFVIWGTYAGQNQVIFDGITLFNSWGINDDIGRINPYMIKNVEVFKGGYNVPFGDRIGGVVLIDGKSGNRKEVTGAVSLTNQLASGHLSIPVFNQSSVLQMAGRITYYQFMDLSSGVGEEDDFIEPEYDFADLNLKFTTNFKNRDKLVISAIGSRDGYDGIVRNPERRMVVQDVEIKSDQVGSSLKYFKTWKRGGVTTLALSQSYYGPELTTNYLRTRGQGPGQGPGPGPGSPMNGSQDTLELDTWDNPIEEYTGNVTHLFAGGRKHHIQLNVGYIFNKTSVESNESGEIISDASQELGRFTLYGYDQIQWTDKLSLQFGLKTDIPDSDYDIYLQPRVNGRYDFSKHWNIHFGWGLYNQFISKNSVIDEIGNRTDIWEIADGERAPVLEAMHNVLGLSYISKDFEVSLEGYYKTSEGFIRYRLRPDSTSTTLQGEARTMGLDVFVRKRFQPHEFWISYSLAQVEERFGDGFSTSEYQLAPQSQRHEVKGAMILVFHAVQFSLTQVYGSGFPNSTLEMPREEFIDYWRTDLAIQYEFGTRELRFETGLSFLNLFNQKNVRLNQSVNVPDGAIVNTLGIPFTPTIYFNIHF